MSGRPGCNLSRTGGEEKHTVVCSPPEPALVMRLGGLCTLQSRINIKIIGRTRGYRLPAGTYPAVDSRSIYDTRVHCQSIFTVLLVFLTLADLWHPQSWFNTEERARLALRRAAAKAFEFEDADKLVEACLKSFFVPYWMARVALYWPIDHATTKRQHTEVRLSPVPYNMYF
jgi:hypothetical protein